MMAAVVVVGGLVIVAIMQLRRQALETGQARAAYCLTAAGAVWYRIYNAVLVRQEDQDALCYIVSHVETTVLEVYVYHQQRVGRQAYRQSISQSTST